MKFTPCQPSELMLFEPPPTQLSIIKSEVINYNTSTTTENGTLEFKIPKVGNLYTDLGSIFLNLKFRILNEKGELYQKKEATEKEAAKDKEQPIPISNFLFSIFKSATVLLNNQQISHTDFLCYEDYIIHLINTDNATISTNLRNQMFVKDTAGEMDTIDKSKNKGIIVRSNISYDSAYVDLCGRLSLDVFNQTRLLLNNCEIKIILTLGNYDFYMLQKSTLASGILKISDVSLSVTHYEINPNVILHHHAQLMKTPAIYPYKRTQLKTFTISQGLTSITLDSCITGHLPSKIVLAMVKNSAFSGKKELNPFNFEHFNLKSLGVYVNGKCLTQQPIQMDYENDLYAKAYQQFLEGSDNIYNDREAAITKTEFKYGYNLYPFIIAPKTSFSNCECLDTLDEGVVRIEMAFDEKLEETVTLILLAEFDAQLLIDKNYNVTIL